MLWNNHVKNSNLILGWVHCGFKNYFSTLALYTLAVELIDFVFYTTELKVIFFDFSSFIIGTRYITFVKCLHTIDYFDIFNILLPKNNVKSTDSTIIACKVKNKSFLYLSTLDSTSDVNFSNFVNEHPELIVKTSEGKLWIDMAKYEKYQEKILLEADMEFWNKLVKPTSFFQSTSDLYEFSDWIPFYKNSKFVNLVDFMSSLTSWTEVVSNIIAYELKQTFYYEPFFFFWGKIEQNLDEFRLLCFFRQRALLLEDWVFGQPLWNDQNYDLPFLSHYKNKSEFKTALKIYKRLYSYKNIRFFSYYIKFDDIQALAFDKKYVHIWNYWVGASHNYDEFGEYGFLGFINFLREKIYTPLTQLDSQFYWEEKGYNSVSAREMQFVFFPDAVMMWGDFNVSFDTNTDYFARFFHFGDNYIDRLQSLDCLRHQITDNLWGDFESLVEDYFTYQPTYVSDNFASLRIPIILLLSWNYESQKNMDMFLNDYNNVFQFWKINEFKSIWAKNLFKLSPLERLEKFRDPMTIDMQLNSMDKCINLFFGYNLSESISNHPKWLLDFFSPTLFFSTLNYDVAEDWAYEDAFVRMVNSLTKYNYNFKTNIPVFFQSYNNFFNLHYFLSYFNEKIYDDYGYQKTPLEWVDWENKFEVFSWLGKNSLFYIEVIPNNHYTWRVFVVNRFFFEWSMDPVNITLANFWNLFQISLFDPKAFTLPQFQAKLCFLTFKLDMFLEYPLEMLRKFFYNSIIPWMWSLIFFYDIFTFLVFNNRNFITSECFDFFNLSDGFGFVTTIKVTEENIDSYEIEGSTISLPVIDDLEFKNRFMIFNLNLNYLLDKLFFNANLGLQIFFSLPYVTYSISTLEETDSAFNFVVWKVNNFKYSEYLPLNFIFPNKILNYFWIKIWPVISYNFFHFHIPVIVIDKLLDEQQLHDTYATAYMWVKYIPLPKSFFIPYVFDINLAPKYTLVRSFDLSELKFYPFLPDGTAVDPRNINHLRDYILYAGVLDINNKRNFDYFLQANVHILNKMDWKDITYNSLEYKRFLNYVVKHKCYRKT